MPTINMNRRAHDYLVAVRRIRQVEGVLAEASLYSSLAQFVQDALTDLGRDGAQAVQQARTAYGVPDLVVTEHGVAIGYIEAKKPQMSLVSLPARDRAQQEQFLNLDNVLYTNYRDFRLYQDGELVAAASLGDPEVLEPAGLEPSAGRVGELGEVLERFLLRRQPAPTNANELARSLARATRVLRDATAALLRREPSGPLARMRTTWQALLFDEVSDQEFANAYAQTVVYGLLTARLDDESADLDIDEAAGILRHQHPFLSAAFRSLTELEIREVLGWAIDVVVVTVRDVGLETFRRARHANDPLLYFYEDFLSQYDDRLRKRRGVYYTPPSVVDFQVRALAEIVDGLGYPQLLADGVVALDPATGTGTYPLALLDETERRVVRAGAGLRTSGMRRAAEHVIGFELLVGPYTVAHQRVSARLKDLGVQDAAVRIYLADTLSQAHDHVAGQLSLLDEQLAEERADVDRVKTAEQVMMVLGNPPYERSRGRGETDWLAGLMRMFTDPVRREARVNLKNLADPYVQFYRWALWKLFESVEPGGPRLLSFISNRSYLLDYAFEGMRRALRERFDEIWIVDLEGESRGAVATENVFDIRVGVCILVGVRRDSAQPVDGEAVVRYTRVHGSRAEKETALKERLVDLAWTTLRRGGGEPFLPEPGGAWRRWAALDTLMPFRQSGVQTKRDALVVAPTKHELARQLRRLDELGLDPAERSRVFHVTRDRQLPNGLPRLDRMRRFGYRPLSIHWLLNDQPFVDFPRPALQGAWFAGQRAFVTLPKGHGAGPAVFQHTELPDLHSFRGSMGGHVFPLWRDQDRRTPNLAPGLLGRLSDHLGEVGAEQVFAYVYGLLSAPSYTHLFREHLAQGFPRVPFPAERESFDLVAAAGARLQAVHALEEQALTAVRLEGSPGRIEQWELVGERLLLGDSAWLAPVRQEDLDYAVSGYRVLERWLKWRVGLDLGRDYDLARELTLVASAVRASVDLGPELDAGLATVLAGPTLGEASVVPLDGAQVARETGDVAYREEMRQENEIWEALSDEALLTAEQRQ